MRCKIIIATILLVFAAGSVVATDAETELVNKYMKRTQEKRTKKLSWFGVDFTMNRINRHNDYNTFASIESANFPNAELQWLNQAPSIGVNMGLLFKDRWAWSVGGEYWMKLGDNLGGPYDYNTGTGTITVQELKSEISVYGITTGMQYYPFAHPTTVNGVERFSLRFGGNVGWYHASWDVWEEYQSLNLSTSSTEGQNITFKGSSLGFSAVAGADYPLGFKNLVLAAEAQYLYLNLGNVAWYNTADQEIVATYNGDASGRVNLDLSGFRARIELKRYFSW